MRSTSPNYTQRVRLGADLEPGYIYNLYPGHYKCDEKYISIPLDNWEAGAGCLCTFCISRLQKNSVQLAWRRAASSCERLTRQTTYSVCDF